MAERAQAIGDELRRLADVVERLALVEPSAVSRSQKQAHPDRWVIADRIGAYMTLRKKRNALFVEGLFSDPAWDILLDLYVAGARGARVSISSCCIGSLVPTTTALRWIGELGRHGLIVRTDDPHDRRRIHVELAPKAIAMVEELWG